MKKTIYELSVSQAEFIVHKILGHERSTVTSIEREPDGIKILETITGQEYPARITIGNDGCVTRQFHMKGKDGNPDSYEFFQLNSLPITDYLREEGFVFNYKSFR